MHVADIDEGSLRDLIGLYRRYDLDLAELGVFLDEDKIKLPFDRKSFFVMYMPIKI